MCDCTSWMAQPKSGVAEFVRRPGIDTPMVAMEFPVALVSPAPWMTQI
jgi:hypothetical protein